MTKWRWHLNALEAQFNTCTDIHIKVYKNQDYDQLRYFALQIIILQGKKESESLSIYSAKDCSV